MRKGVIYRAILNFLSYIGQTLDFDTRKAEHQKAKGDNHFHRAIRKYGWRNIEWQIIACEVPENLLPEIEKWAIAHFDTYNNGYNMTTGGEVSPMKNPETRKKSSKTKREQAARGEHSSQRPSVKKRMSETRQAISARGEHSSSRPEVQKKMSETRHKLLQEGKIERVGRRPARSKIAEGQLDLF